MNYWEQFGLTSSPYSTLPLNEGGELAISKSFVGRLKERTYIHNLFNTQNRACIAICGDVGTGKTSFVNYIKYSWKYPETEKPLFSFRREIEATDTLLNKKNFILEIIGSILREIEITDPGLLKNNDFLQKLNQMVDITQTIGLSGGISANIFGLTLQSTIAERQLIQPLKLTAVSLEKQFLELLRFIKTHKIAGKQYRGLIIHVNNFETAMKNNNKKVIAFFSEIRDFLQTPDLYFLFLGPNHFYKDVLAKETRVASVFQQSPLLLAPLSSAELTSALRKRIALFKSPTVKKVIPPFEEDVTAELYTLFSGDIRMVLSTLQDIVGSADERLPKTLSVDEAFLVLARTRLGQLRSHLTSEQLKILAFIAASDHYVTQNEIATALQKSPANVSNYYFKPLLEYNIIEIKEISGRNKYWGLTKQYLPLKRAVQSQINVARHITEIVEKIS